MLTGGQRKGLLAALILRLIFGIALGLHLATWRRLAVTLRVATRAIYGALLLVRCGPLLVIVAAGPPPGRAGLSRLDGRSRGQSFTKSLLECWSFSAGCIFIFA